MQPVEVSGPEGIVLHNDRDNARLQLSHEGIVPDQLLHSRLEAGKVKGGAPGLVVSSVGGLVTVRGAVTLHAADVSIKAAVFALAQRARALSLHLAFAFV